MKSRFVGLFTSEAYDRPAFEVPLIRKKAEHVLNEARILGLNGGYNEKRLKNIVETYPRDELFQMSEADLLRIARGILHLSDRPRVRLFTRADPFDRFISVLLYIPRELLPVADAETGRRNPRQGLSRPGIGQLSLHFGIAALVRPLYHRRPPPGDHFDPDINDLEADITNIVRSWPQKVVAQVEALVDNIGVPEQVAPTPRRHRLDRLGPRPSRLAIRSATPPSMPSPTPSISPISAPMRPSTLRAYQRMEDDERVFCFKLYTRARTRHPAVRHPAGAGQYGSQDA
ncbi:MAG: hypothetical protein WDN06_07650 [Asticcacaulis sp.]